MATVAVLNVAVKASTGGFERSMRGVVATLGGLPGAIAGIAAKASLLKSAFMDSVRATDQISETARMLGMTTDTFSRIGFAAGQLGVDATVLGTKLMRLNKNIGAVRKAGKGPLKAALKDLGVSFDQFTKMSVEEQLIALADGFAKLPGRADRTRVAFDLFGKSGAGVLNMFTEGGDALRGMFEEADRLGITIKQLDASKAEMLVDLAEKFRLRWEAVKRMLATALLPPLIAIGEMILSWSTSTDAWGETITGWLDSIIDGFAELGRASNFVKAIWSGMRGALARLQTGVIQLAKEIAGALLALEERGEPAWLRKWAKLFEHVSDFLYSASKRDKLGGIPQLLGSGAAEMGGFGLNTVANWLESAIGVISPHTDLLRNTVDEMEQRAKELEKASTDLFDNAAEEFHRAWTATHPAVQNFKDTIGKVHDAAREAARKAAEAAGGAAPEVAPRLGKEPPAIEAATRGSAEYIEALRKVVVPDRQMQVLEAQLQQQKQMVQGLQKIERKLEGPAVDLF